MDRGALPIIAKTVDAGDIVKITAGDQSFDLLIENIALNNIADALEKSNIVPSQEELMNELVKEHKRLSSSKNVFVKAVQKLMTDGIETKVHITNEDIDTNVAINHLMTLMNIPPENRDQQLLKQVYDLMGLNMPKAPLPQQIQQPQQMGAMPSPMQPQGNPQPMENPTVQGIAQNAMIPNING
jgi:hypothetical protein